MSAYCQTFQPSCTPWSGLPCGYDLDVVECGNVLTSAGISAGIDLALLLVAKLLGEPVARATAKHMEYPYPEGVGRRVAV